MSILSLNGSKITLLFQKVEPFKVGFEKLDGVGPVDNRPSTN